MCQVGVTQTSRVFDDNIQSVGFVIVHKGNERDLSITAMVSSVGSNIDLSEYGFGKLDNY